MCDPLKAKGLPMGAGGAIGLKAMGIMGLGPGAPIGTCEGNCWVAMPMGPYMAGMADIIPGPKGPIGEKPIPGGIPGIPKPGGKPGMPGIIGFLAVVDSSFFSSFFLSSLLFPFPFPLLPSRLPLSRLNQLFTEEKRPRRPSLFPFPFPFPLLLLLLLLLPSSARARSVVWRRHTRTTSSRRR